MSGDHVNKLEATLKNWKKWQEEWQKIQGTIAEKLQRNTGDLLANFSDGIQSLNNEKQVLEYAKIPTEFDKYRGKPDFYKLPEALPKKCKCCCNVEPTYFAVKTKPEKYIVPSVELVGVPERIRQEKNVLNGARNIYKKWQDSKYRQKQMEALADKIKNIVPHWPLFNDLVVVGTRIAHNKEHHVVEIREDAKNVVHSAKESGELPKAQSFIRRPRLALKVNGALLSAACEKIRLFFEYDISSGGLSVDFLTFENVGLSTMRVSWRKIEKFRLFRNYTKEKWESGFYFDKKELVILPGCKLDLPIWFETDNSGTTSESWELITTPKLSKESQVILLLESYAYFKDLKEKVNETIKYIDVEARNLIIKDILRDITEGIRYKDKEIEPCVYGEAQLFELTNMVNERPLFCFNETFFNDLKHIYDKLKTGEEKWDNCVKTLFKLARLRDTHIYSENKLAARISGQTGESPSESGKSEKKKPKGDKAKTPQHSTANAEETKLEILEEPYEYSTQGEVWNVVRKFDTPVIINSEREKHFACFSTMAAYFNKMCHLLEEVEYEKRIIKEDNYPQIKHKLVPIDELPKRLVYEYFEHHYIPRHPTVEVHTFDANRKPKIVKDIPSDDIETLYTTYFNKSIVKKEVLTKKVNKKDKKKTKKPDKSKGSKKSKGKKEHSKEEVPKKETSIESFNPYAEYFTYVSETEEVETPQKMEVKHLSPETAEDYHYKQYLVVYSCLSSAVDAFVDTINSFECVVSHSTLNEMREQINHFQN